MAISTFAELKTSIANWLNRDDLTAVIPDFITLAESKLEKEIRHYMMENRATTGINNRFTALPLDFLQPIRFHMTGYAPLAPMSMQDMQVKRYECNDATGTPRYYCLSQEDFEVFPTPDGSYTGELLYYQSLPKLSDSQTTNWLLDTAPEIYLYGSLLEAAPYLMEDERLVTWGALLKSSIDKLQLASDRAKWGGAGLRLRTK